MVMGASETVDKQVYKSAREFLQKLENEGHLVYLSEADISSLVLKTPLPYKDVTSKKLVAHQYSVGRLKVFAEQYFESWRHAYSDLKKVADYKRLADENPQNPNYLKHAEYFAKNYLANQQKHEEAKHEFAAALGETLAYQQWLSRNISSIPKPNIEAIEGAVKGHMNLQKLPIEVLTTISLATVFSLLLIYLTNPPGTAGFAVLPSYGTTTILLSIIVLTALIFLFKKHR